MTEKKQIKRLELRSEPYVYYSQKLPAQYEHIIGVNWIYLWMLRKYSCWVPWHWEYETSYCSSLRSDGFLILDNLFRKEKLLFFIENERSHNSFMKVQRYTQFYEQADKNKHFWWWPYATGFPSIIIAVEDERIPEIKRAIAEGNKYGLDFQVVGTERMIADVRSTLSGGNKKAAGVGRS